MGDGPPYKVMLVDDSAVIRGLFKRWIEEDPAIQVVSSASNGVMAIKQLTPEVEVVVMDVEMPEMDGITALPKMLEKNRDLKVIMASTLTRRNADISMKAMQMGASDYVPKPTSTHELHSAVDFRQEVISRIKALGATLRQKRGQALPPAGASVTAARPTGLASSSPHVLPNSAGFGGSIAGTGRTGSTPPPISDSQLVARAIHGKNKDVTFRPPSKVRPEILAIGSSTGGPQALFKVFEHLKTSVSVPIVITQHMPPTFTSILAEHLTRVSGGKANEGQNGEPLLPGRIYVAPGDHHMVIAEEGGKKVIKLNQDPPENFCRPAVDPMFRSVAKTFGSKSLCVVLTGMGQDGLNGGRAIADVGGTLIAQDEATSVVWGMPGACAMGGVCSALYPIDQVGPAIAKLLSGGGL